MEKSNVVSKCLLIIFIFLPGIALARTSVAGGPLRIVDLMNTVLILICSLFVIAILFVLADKRLHELLKSAQFLNMNTIVTSWMLVGGAFLLYAVSEIGYTFGFITDIRLYMLLKTIFAVLFGAGLFMRYQVILKYIKKLHEKERG